MEEQPLYKRTLLTVGAMLGASVAFVGMLSLLTVMVLGKAVGEPSSAALSESTKADTIPGVGARPDAKSAPKSTPVRTTPPKPSTAI